MDSITNHPLLLTVIIAIPLFGAVAKLFGATFERLTKWYLYLAVFAIVVVMSSMFFPFIGGKDFFFRYVVSLALICFVFHWALEAREGEVGREVKALFKRPLVIAVTAFVLMYLLAALFAYDPYSAFWSNYERGEGAFQMLHYLAFFILLALSLKTEDDWKNIFRFSLVAAGWMIIYGLLGNFGVAGTIGPYAGGPTAPSGWLHKLIDGRFQGTLGNPAYVAPYLMFSMFYAAYLWARRKAGASLKTLLAWGTVVLLAIFLVFFILSQTRGAFLGLAAGLIVLLVYFVLAGRGHLRKWSAIIFLFLAVLGAGLYSVRNSPYVQSLPEGRLLQISTSDYTAQTRFWVWGEAWKGFLERPILGWGPENFTTVFDRHFDPRFFVPGQNTETWFDRAHSVFFDYLAETGILGLLAYLSIFVIFAWEFLRKERGMERSAGIVVTRGLLLALPIAYLVQGVAIFDVLPMYINLFLFMAFAYFYFYHHQHHGQNA